MRSAGPDHFQTIFSKTRFLGGCSEHLLTGWVNEIGIEVERYLLHNNCHPTGPSSMMQLQSVSSSPGFHFDCWVLLGAMQSSLIWNLS